MHGLQFVQPVKGDYIRGGRVQLGSLPIRPDGQWDNFLPDGENQGHYMEPENCTSENTLNPVEILQRQEFGDTTNWSDRFLAWKSGTTRTGNDPHKVAETLRKYGTPIESDWPYTPDINTWDKFYAQPPYQIEVNGIAAFGGRYNFGHQWVNPDPQSMKNALQYSPLGADVYAWNNPDSDGIYHREGMASEHWVTIYGYVPGKYWKVFDSYPPYQKKIAWDFGFSMVKEYTLYKTVLTTNPLDPKYLWACAIRWLQQFAYL